MALSNHFSARIGLLQLRCLPHCAPLGLVTYWPFVRHNKPAIGVHLLLLLLFFDQKSLFEG